ncbi:hypothetical protein ACFOOP_19020 [Marinicaulis aureus]|uniref:DUF4129 domain-containing protein n=1 Tax=Hyphococcus aureus TaxID=2666033 RepID=A0ABW1KZI5_9PROT
MISGRQFFSAINALGGIACILIGIFLDQIEPIFVSQPPGSDSFVLIQAHWIAIGLFSLIVSASKSTSQFWVSLLFFSLMLNGWLGGKALLVGDPKFSWVLAFPVLSFLNLFQLLAQNGASKDANEIQDDGAEKAVNEPLIPADFYELKSLSPAAAVTGVMHIGIVVALQIVLLVLFFFYGALMVRVIFEGADIDFARIPDVLGGVFWKILYIPVIIILVYSIFFLIQIVIERIAVGSGSAAGEDVNRSLSIQERTFIEKSLQSIDDYISDASFPASYSWLYWSAVLGLIAWFLALPVLVFWLEAEFFNAVEVSGIPEESVISSFGPGFIGGVAFSFLFASTAYWAVFQWLGKRHQRFGEYLHMRCGWNSMNGEPRPLQSYAKIFTRFVRKRRYDPDQQIDPQQFIREAYDEFSGFIYKASVLLGIAAVIFTALDVNWRRIVHTDGLHYSPYFDWRSYDLTLDEIVRVELRCFLFDGDDDEERVPGVGYDAVFSNSMRGYLLEGELNDDLLSKVEAIDAKLRSQGVPVSKAEHAGAVILRGINGYWPDCEERVLPKLDADIRSRVGALLDAAP